MLGLKDCFRLPMSITWTPLPFEIRQTMSGVLRDELNQVGPIRGSHERNNQLRFGTHLRRIFAHSSWLFFITQHWRLLSGHIVFQYNGDPNHSERFVRRYRRRRSYWQINTSKIIVRSSDQVDVKKMSLSEIPRPNYTFRTMHTRISDWRTWNRTPCSSSSFHCK